MRYTTSVNGITYQIEINSAHQIMVDGEVFSVDFESVSHQPLYSLLLDGGSHEAYIEFDADGWQVLHHGDRYTVTVADERTQRLAQLGGMQAAAGGREFLLKAPMPGLVVSVPVAAGQPVERGDLLLVLESMKMQNELRAPRAGTVQRVRAQAGQSVEQNTLLLVIT